jgi:hypothetical protein
MTAEDAKPPIAVPNIDSAAIAPPPWNAGSPGTSLDALYRYAEDQAARASSWYYRKKDRKAFWSWVLRSGTVLLTAAGGLIPVIVVALGYKDEQQLRFNQWGYVAIGLAGVTLAFDRFTGSSTGWMRYIGCAMSIETLLEEFRMDWRQLAAARGDTADAATVAAALDRLKAFSTALRGLIEKETQAWMTEFQSSLTQLEKQTSEVSDAVRQEAKRQADALEAARAKAAEAHRPGAIQLTIEGNGPGSYSISLDGSVVRTGVMSGCGLLNVAPGLHEISISGGQNGNAVHASKFLEVEGGKICAAALSPS